MSLDAFVERMRRREEDTWRSQGILTRPSGTTTFDPATGQGTPDPPTLIYPQPGESGECDVVAPRQAGFARETQAGEREVSIAVLTLKLPADTPAQKNDEFEVTASTYDAGLVGRTFRITRVLWHGKQIARRCDIEEVT